MELPKGLQRQLEKAAKKRAAYDRRRAAAVHEARTEHVVAGINELHHLVTMTIALELLTGDRHQQLEREVLEATNRARAAVDEATGSGDPGHRLHELMASSVMAMK